MVGYNELILRSTEKGNHKVREESSLGSYSISIDRLSAVSPVCTTPESWVKGRFQIGSLRRTCSQPQWLHGKAEAVMFPALPSQE